MPKTVFNDLTTPVTAEELNGWQNHVHDGVDDNGHASKIELEHHTDLDFGDARVNIQHGARAWCTIKNLSGAIAYDCTSKTGIKGTPTRVGVGHYTGVFEDVPHNANALPSSGIEGIGATASVHSNVPASYSINILRLNDPTWTLKVWDLSGNPYDPISATITAFWEHT